MDNQQLYQFDNEQLQVLYTARLGDGCLATSNSNSTYYVTNCKYIVIITNDGVQRLSRNGVRLKGV